mmetsp:Transcript_5845/g.11972  ORF Transcript_5845/g.11972 Transcript_5845/m.11972 type:complete len:127 (+) Transcript_5845:208-588(+)
MLLFTGSGSANPPACYFVRCGDGPRRPSKDAMRRESRGAAEKQDKLKKHWTIAERSFAAEMPKVLSCEENEEEEEEENEGLSRSDRLGKKARAVLPTLNGMERNRKCWNGMEWNGTERGGDPCPKP